MMGAATDTVAKSVPGIANNITKGMMNGRPSEIKEAETTAEKPEEQVVEQSKPEGLPEKFNSVEDLAKSYAELEKKLGEPKPQETPEPKQEEAKPDDLEIAKRLQKLQDLICKTQSEFDNTGELKLKVMQV